MLSVEIVLFWKTFPVRQGPTRKSSTLLESCALHVEASISSVIKKYILQCWQFYSVKLSGDSILPQKGCWTVCLKRSTALYRGTINAFNLTKQDLHVLVFFSLYLLYKWTEAKKGVLKELHMHNGLCESIKYIETNYNLAPFQQLTRYIHFGVLEQFAFNTTYSVIILVRS